MLKLVIALSIGALVVAVLQVEIGRESIPKGDRVPLRKWRWSDIWHHAALGPRTINDLYALQAQRRRQARSQWPQMPPEGSRKRKRPDL